MCGGYIWTPDLNKERLPDAVRSRAASCLCRAKSMPPKRNPKRKPKNEICKLCTQELSDEVLQCSGTCNVHAHRYCAGVTTSHYKKIRDPAELSGKLYLSTLLPASQCCRDKLSEG